MRLTSGPLVAAVLAATLALSACGSSSEESTASGNDKPYRLYMLLSQTGALAAAAQAELEGMTAAVDAINDAGGIDGRTVELSVGDDKLDPTTATTLLQEQIDDAKPDFVWAGMTSNISLAVLPLLTRNDILSGSNTQSDQINDPATYPNHFALVSENSLEAVAAAADLADQGVETVAILAANDANGQSVSGSYTAALEDQDMTVVTESYSPTDLDMTAQMQRLQADDPDVLLLQGFGAAAGYLLKSRTTLGWDVPTVATSSVGNGNNLANISSAADWNNLELLVYPINTPERSSADNPNFTALTDSLEEQGSDFDQLMQLYTAPWDILHLVQLGVDQAGSTTTDDVSAALEDLDQPSDEVPYLQFPVERFSSDSHFLDLDADDAFVYVTAGPVVDGTIQSQG